MIKPQMKVGKSSVIRKLLSKSAFQPRHEQRRWARVQDIRSNDVRYLATQVAQDRVFEKYRDKLKRKARDEGHPDIASLKHAYQAKVELLRTQAVSSAVTRKIAQNTGEVVASQPIALPTRQQSADKAETGPIKSLSSFLDVQKTLGLAVKEIEYVWRLRHAKNPRSLCAVVAAEQFAHMQLMARKHPQFILPVPREEQGAEIHFMQWSFSQASTATVLFTQLAEYKVRGEYATPHTTVSFHTELLQAKGLVLVEGEVQEKRGVSVDDGKWLLMCLQKIYGKLAKRDGTTARGSTVATTTRLLKQFSDGDQAFQIRDLLDEVERIG